MKFYVSVDMEGIAGIAFKEQITRGETLYQEARQLLTDEVNAVVEGLVRAGAKEIIVKDAHATGYNFLFDRLHPAASYVVGPLAMSSRFPGVDSTFDGALLVGYHGMAGTEGAILDHSWSIADIFGLELNGTPIGEIGFEALLFGLHGVPVIFVSGDDKTCDEAKKQLGTVFTYETKKAAGRHSGLLKAPKRVQKEIGESAMEAVRRRKECSPYSLPAPYEMKITYINTSLADTRYYDDKEAVRLDGRTKLIKDTDLLRLFSRTFG
ncbi:M55 family metallopeptidase [Paenibacillus sp. PAMC21692]|uniref:M55 family metallopeptidase n=1 Tax=Paenibacillus sp. PAMC21692 TaxID=2762320 RepID=UPI00164D6718|nr:M55 family metallopeptidase [Paenibacillus sp. PAMC21692]QNK54891.1 M55 family metallopeptidase [Paenibacillus sp. PAMC21692]